jgi:hypothetical protein
MRHLATFLCTASATWLYIQNVYVVYQILYVYVVAVMKFYWGGFYTRYTVSA